MKENHLKRSAPGEEAEPAAGTLKQSKEVPKVQDFPVQIALRWENSVTVKPCIEEPRFSKLA